MKIEYCQERRDFLKRVAFVVGGFAVGSYIISTIRNPSTKVIYDGMLGGKYVKHIEIEGFFNTSTRTIVKMPDGTVWDIIDMYRNRKLNAVQDEFTLTRDGITQKYNRDTIWSEELLRVLREANHMLNSILSEISELEKRVE